MISNRFSQKSRNADACTVDAVVTKMRFCAATIEGGIFKVSTNLLCTTNSTDDVKEWAEIWAKYTMVSSILW